MKTINFKPDANGFPMVLDSFRIPTIGVKVTQKKIRIVHNVEIEPQDRIENGNELWQVDTINESRPAKGAYTDDSRPTYYDLSITLIGKVQYVNMVDGVVRKEILN